MCKTCSKNRLWLWVRTRHGLWSGLQVGLQLWQRSRHTSTVTHSSCALSIMCRRVNEQSWCFTRPSPPPAHVCRAVDWLRSGSAKKKLNIYAHVISILSSLKKKIKTPENTLCCGRRLRYKIQLATRIRYNWTYELVLGPLLFYAAESTLYSYHVCYPY